MGIFLWIYFYFVEFFFRLLDTILNVQTKQRCIIPNKQQQQSKILLTFTKHNQINYL